MGFIGRRFDFVNGCKKAERPEPTVCSPHSPRTPPDGETPRLSTGVNLLIRRSHGG